MRGLAWLGELYSSHLILSYRLLSSTDYSNFVSFRRNLNRRLKCLIIAMNVFHKTSKDIIRCFGSRKPFSVCWQCYRRSLSVSFQVHRRPFSQQYAPAQPWLTAANRSQRLPLTIPKGCRSLFIQTEDTPNADVSLAILQAYILPAF